MARPASDNRRTAADGTTPARAERREPVPPRIPPSLRHCEIACATILWISFLPLVLILSSGSKAIWFTATVSVVVLITLLLVHSCTLRPFYTETGDLDEHDEYSEMWVIDGPNHHDDVHHFEAKVPTSKMPMEEFKLVCMCMLVLSSVGCAISLTAGGAFVFRFWTARNAVDCTVSSLVDIQQDGYAKFSCIDGYVDFEHQLATIQREHTVQGSTYTTYNMAPVFQNPDDAVPVAWAAAKNVHLDSGFQARLSDAVHGGLSGVIVTTKKEDSSMCKGLVCATEKEQKGFDELKHAFIKNLKASGPAADTHLQYLPTVELTSLTNPEGKIRHFIYAVVLYLITLFGLIVMQLDYIKEARSRPSVGPSTETRYEALSAASSQ